MFNIKITRKSDEHQQMLDDIELLGKTLAIIRDQYEIVSRIYHRDSTNTKHYRQRVKLDAWEYRTLCELNTLEKEVGMTLTMPMGVCGITKQPIDEVS